MESDFQSKYAGYTNTQLLLILQNRDQYQPADVATAEAILATRTITQQELDEVTSIATQPAATVVTKQPWQEGMSVFYDGEKGLHEIQQAHKWKIVIEIAIGIQMVILGAGALLLLMDSLVFDAKFVISVEPVLIVILTLVMVPGIILFTNYRRAGWIMATSYAFFFLTISFGWLYIGFVAGNNVYQILCAVIEILLNAGTIYLLMLSHVRRSYDIDAPTAKCVAGITGAASLLYMAITQALAI